MTARSRAITQSVIGDALLGVREHRLNYWDAQIWATARVHGVATVFSEDFQDGTRIEGVQFVNPFASGFDLAAWA